MAEARHTPGPWSMIHEFDYEPSYIDAPPSSTGYDESMEICKVSCQDEEAQRANARLIAAAPDLLQALEKMYEICNMAPDSAPHRVLAKAAIDKAKGSDV